MNSKPTVRHIAHAAAESDCTFEVSRADGAPAVVKSLRFLDAARRDTARWIGQPVGELLAAVAARMDPRVVAALVQTRGSDRVEVLLPDSDRAFRVVTTHALDAGTVRMTVRCLDAQLLPDLIDAKVARVSEASNLSDRERQVLQLLLRGRGVEDIATMLEIAPRTVKFHQANVLQKLGADSRLDLLRVVL
jgi:DNA-binding CsgD family transcriptional regulator